MKELMPWKLLHSELVFDHRWYKVRQDVVELSNGAIVDDYFLSVRPDVALVFPVTAKREIVFVRQYRHGAGKVLVELPAGTFDPQKESAESAALRELQEETGYCATHLTKLATLYDNPVKETNKIHLFLADNVELVSAQNLDHTEEIEVLLIPIDAVQEKLSQGEISVSGTVAAVL
ncbi:NUDIX hydrolase [Leptolyngbya sp. FACHB-541]|uniref:NUDIX hydrolase n=1 Tax=Leptolyngbya sp. FACHB-541 TaxID=2692810 RepID=UPI001684F572|nr:NUDIX hydrolase [Leptolyngbya sp. FACHB-541]MBD1995670.1 NUDIX hydrolase [Leptolyngbya sp. FACHB-541]